MGLLSGAASVVAELFAIPASDRCTGVIVVELVAALLEGYPAAEALRPARERYWRPMKAATEAKYAKVGQ